MRLFTIVLFVTFSFVFRTQSFAGKVEIDQIVLNLEKLDVQNLGIVVWDQREMVVDRSQPESFLGYTRSMTGIAYGHITKSQKSLVDILRTKIEQAYEAKGSKVGTLSISPYESQGDLIHKIKNSPYDKVLVLRLNNLIFDGVRKIEFVVDIETKIYDNEGIETYTNNVSSHIPLGVVDKRKKTVPTNLTSTMEGILNNESLHSELSKANSVNNSTLQFDQLLTKEGEEIEVKVLEITESTIKYKLPNQLDGPIRNIAREQVFMIKYSDGTKEVLN